MRNPNKKTNKQFSGNQSFITQNIYYSKYSFINPRLAPPSEILFSLICLCVWSAPPFPVLATCSSLRSVTRCVRCRRSSAVAQCTAARALLEETFILSFPQYWRLSAAHPNQSPCQTLMTGRPSDMLRLVQDPLLASQQCHLPHPMLKQSSDGS